MPKRVLAFVATLVLAASAVAADLDLSPIASHVDAQAAATSGRTRHAYLRLQRTLAAPGRPGLRGDFHKLRVVAQAAERALDGDEVLLDAVQTALFAGQSALGDERSRLVALAAALDDEHDRARCGATSAAAGHLAARSVEASIAGDRTNCARLARRAAAKYDDGVALASKLLARQDARPAAWSVPLHDLGGALLSVCADAGPTPAVYAVGASDAAGPLFLRMGAEGWVRVPIAPSGALWWVSQIGGDVFSCGTGGRVVRYAPETASVADLSTGVDATLYGVWGASATDVWAVGGNVDGSLPHTVLLHHDGNAWSSVAPPEGTNDRTIFKVWGTAADDVWACGQAGLILHFDGAAWSVQTSGTFESLFTVQGASPTIAVGGTVQPGIVELGGQGFAAATVPAGSETLRGVFVPPGRDAWACGLSATVLRRTAGRWQRVAGLPDATGRDFHAVCVDDAGGVYLAGGNLITMEKGSLFYFGPRTIPTGIWQQAKLRGAVQPVLYASCGLTGCHVAPFISENLDLATAETIRAQDVGVPSNQSPLLRVLAGRPSQSYLWHKILGTQASAGGSGSRMPQGGPYLDEPGMDAVRAWILEGARDN